MVSSLRIIRDNLEKDVCGFLSLVFGGWGVTNTVCLIRLRGRKKNLPLPVETAVSIKSSVGFYICFIVCLFFEQSLLNLMN